MYGNGFYNPYMYNSFINTANIGRNISSITKPTIGLGNLLKKFNLSNFLNGASKTLNVVNQVIPIYYQVKPMINNAKTMFKVMKAVKTPDYKLTNNTTGNNVNDKSSKIDYSNNSNPTFFI